MDWSLHNLQFEGMHVFGNKMYQLTMQELQLVTQMKAPSYDLMS